MNLETIKKIFAAPLPISSTTAHKSGVPVEDLREQIEKYENLPLRKSFKGAAISVILIFLFIEYVMVLDGRSSGMNWFLLLCLIFLPLAYLFYKGYLWGMILTLVVWTAMELYFFFASPQLGELVLWFFFFIVFYKAAVVEYYRKKYLRGNFNLAEAILNQTQKPNWKATIITTFVGFFLCVILSIAYFVAVYGRWSAALGWTVFIIYLIGSGMLIKAINRKLRTSKPTG